MRPALAAAAGALPAPAPLNAPPGLLLPQEELDTVRSELPAKDVAYHQLQAAFYRLQHMYVTGRGLAAAAAATASATPRRQAQRAVAVHAGARAGTARWVVASRGLGAAARGAVNGLLPACRHSPFQRCCWRRPSSALVAGWSAPREVRECWRPAANVAANK